MSKSAGALLLSCPHCAMGLVGVRVGGVTLGGCGSCHGVWVDTKAFEKICKDRGHRAGVLGLPRVIPTKPPSAVRAVKCPVCLEVMEATKFDNCSGVAIDVCRRHGTWLDADELQEIASYAHRGEDEALRKAQVIRSAKKAEEVWAKSANRDPGSGWMWWDGIDVAGGVFEIGCSVFSLFDGV